ncbi:hypothetical protein GQ55_6G134300 [Panicum hallii var. hallii]|uniref:Lecithin-cholesterol acyltransferase-like 1 n=1 Tax=Panicum hallii var. hallii TaxID=1504633 RepID=A0A2T7D621_9POAL|nr:hypothetical protein GQ55_6G134300 [Panicum hallii var. hallii]
MATQLYRLLPLLFLPFVLFRHGASPPPLSQHTVTGGDPGRHPVVLLPGNTCSQLEARLTDAYQPPSPQCGAAKGNGRWFRLWKNSTAMQDPELAPCLSDQLRLVYDPVARDFRNVPGVETRVLGFGSTRGFLADTPANQDLCMGKLVEALEKGGYRDGETLFGAPFDFRQAPAALGQPCRAFSQFSRRLRALVEHASRKNGGKPVVVMSHSQGGYFALEFLNRSPLPWRRRYVRHYVMASIGPGGFLLSMQLLASNPSAALSSGSAFIALPSPKVFGPDAPLVVTRARNYTAQDIPEFLTAIGLPRLAVTLYQTRALPVKLNFRAPVVPTTCINGVGVPTMKELVYWDGNFSKAPEVVYGDGDDLILLESTLALDTVIGDDPRQEYYKSIKLAGTSHAGVVSDGAALERVISEILGVHE